MYRHAKVFIYDKRVLEQAIRDAFREPLGFSIHFLVIDKFGDDNILLIERQLEMLERENIVSVVCDGNQILNYAHSFLTKEQLLDILKNNILIKQM